jgi:hypothetical protein
MPKKWIPLESNPEIITEFAGRLGLDTAGVAFHDVLGLDEEVCVLVGGGGVVVVVVVLLLLLHTLLAGLSRDRQTPTNRASPRASATHIHTNTTPAAGDGPPARARGAAAVPHHQGERGSRRQGWVRGTGLGRQHSAKLSDVVCCSSLLHTTIPRTQLNRS